MLKSHLGTKFDNIDKISANAVQRKRLLRLLMRYYELHVQSFRQPKSLDILYEVFND
jgi:DNA repair protein RecO (recombination protein O)